MKHTYKATFIELNGETIYRCVDCGKMTKRSPFRGEESQTIEYIIVGILALLAVVSWIGGLL